MIRDILTAIREQMEVAQPPGRSAVAPDATNTGTGAVAFTASTQVFGAFEGLLKVTAGGSPGVAVAVLSLDRKDNLPDDEGNNFDLPFTLPATDYAVPLPPVSPGLGSPGPSGLELSFSGSFAAGDRFTFSAAPQVTHLVGEEEVSSQDTLFPRVVHVLTDDDFTGTEDYAQGRDQRTQPRSIATAVAHCETHCWGCDYDRTEALRDLVINGIHFGVQATRALLGGRWENTKKLGKAGQLYVLRWSVRKPVLVIRKDTVPVAPPFTATLSQLVQT